MRIIAGRFRGHQLVSFKANHIRPTTDRVKESIFNKLQARLSGSCVLDLFSGTGALAIEALSRGASSVVAVEKNPKSLKIIRQNLEKLKIEDEIEVQARDAFEFVKNELSQFDLIFVDPPFTQKLAHDIMSSIAASKIACPGSIVIIEASSHERIDEKYSGYNLLDRKDFGDKSVSYFEKE